MPSFSEFLVSVVAVAVVIVVAGAPAVAGEVTVDQCLCRIVSGSGDSRVHLDPAVHEHVPCAVADSPADQCGDAVVPQELGQSAVGVAAGVQDGGLAGLGVEDLELPGLSEVLEDLSVVVSHCESHAFASINAVYIIS